MVLPLHIMDHELQSEILIRFLEPYSEQNGGKHVNIFKSYLRDSMNAFRVTVLGASCYAYIWRNKSLGLILSGKDWK